MDRNEKKWFKKFYEGTLLIKGWKDRTKEILQAVPPENKEEIRKTLDVLGEKIGREWARDNSTRRIDTGMLQQWGEELVTAKKEGYAALKEKIHKVDTEADKILS